MAQSGEMLSENTLQYSARIDGYVVCFPLSQTVRIRGGGRGRAPKRRRDCRLLSVAQHTERKDTMA